MHITGEDAFRTCILKVIEEIYHLKSLRLIRKYHLSSMKKKNITIDKHTSYRIALKDKVDFI